MKSMYQMSFLNKCLCQNKTKQNKTKQNKTKQNKIQYNKRFKTIMEKNFDGSSGIVWTR